MRRPVGVAVAAVLGVLVALAIPLAVSAALLWTLTASPLAVGTGTPTTFTLTAANLLLGRIECVVVDVPANFSVASVAVVGSTAGDSWVGAQTGNRVTVWTTSGGDRLELLDSVTFTVGATAMRGGSLGWAANAYDRHDCGGPGSLLGVPPVVVVTGPAVTPSPVPTLPATPAPTLLPTPKPTPTPSAAPTRTPTPSANPLDPLPSIPLPVPLPTIGLPVRPTPTPRPEPTPTASPSPTSDADASTPDIGQSTGGASGAPPPVSGPTGPAAQTVDSPVDDARAAAPRLGFDEPELGLGVESLGLLAGAPVWVVPVATIGGPGLIVLLWVALQAGGVSIWIPAARRLRGEERRSHRAERVPGG